MKLKIREITSGSVFGNNPLLGGICFLTLIVTMTISLLNGLATGIFVVCSYIACLLIKWLLSKLVPYDYRLVVYMLGACSVVALGELASSALYPDFASRMELYLPITAVYCILDRSFDFDGRNLRQIIVPALWNGLGFIIVCSGIGLVRELLAFGTILGKSVFGKGYLKMPTLVLPAGGMLVFAFALALLSHIRNRGGRS